ncbi:MAG: efflux RND transporter periplasmic adaptor subunit [Candidatus Roizmanbacteria bacterium]
MKKIITFIKQPSIFRIFIGTILVLLLTGGSIFYLKTEQRVQIENSIVQGSITSVTSISSGKLKKLFVVDGQKVRKGDSLAVVGSDIIYSFIDGIVIDTNKQIGSNVTQQTTIVKIMNSNEMRIDGTLDENKGLNLVKVGQTVAFTIDALPGQEFWGFVDEVAPSAKQSAVAYSISSERPTQQFEIFVRFDANRFSEIKNGMSAKMSVYTRQ